jgi:ureidoacrylate peracid hydrolase
VDIAKRLNPRNAVLIVIDVQNDFCHPEGAMSEMGRSVEHAIAAVSELERLISAARKAKVPVIFVRTTHDETTDSEAWLGRYGKWTSGTKTCLTGTWGAEFYRVDPEPEEPVVVKHRYDGFAGTSLDIVLKSLGRRSLLFSGVATNVCVESTLRSALNHYDYHVTLVEDCCAAYGQEEHHATVRTVQSQFGPVLRSDEVIERWIQVDTNIGMRSSAGYVKNVRDAGGDREQRRIRVEE